jgi:hypothetical protein
MCGNKDMFCDLDNSFKESVKLGDDLGLIVQGKGMVRLEVNGIVFMITRVFYV